MLCILNCYVHFCNIFFTFIKAKPVIIKLFNEFLFIFNDKNTYTPSTTTATPAGCTAFVTATAICLVRRSCT